MSEQNRTESSFCSRTERIASGKCLIYLSIFLKIIHSFYLSDFAYLLLLCLNRSRRFLFIYVIKIATEYPDLATQEPRTSAPSKCSSTQLHILNSYEESIYLYIKLFCVPRTTVLNNHCYSRFHSHSYHYSVCNFRHSVEKQSIAQFKAW